jgi:uncharacterized membrane protein SpoIIM required for sporulation
MRQQDFESRYAARWEEFSDWLIKSQAPRSRRVALPTPLTQSALHPVDVPARYRELCQHLALARDRQYSAELIERLSRLALAGHQRLYGAHGRAATRVRGFILGGFPAAVRRQWRSVLLAVLLFFGPLLAVGGALQRYPDFAYVVLPAKQIEDFEQMYGKGAKSLGRTRDAGDDAVMFGFYIRNNVQIGFQTFAGGIVFGIGAAFYLLYNGLFAGAAMGHLVDAGMSTNFFSFVSGHSAFELTAIVLCGAAGLRLGYSLIAPGRLRRVDALRVGAREALPLVIGSAGMLVLAAGIEAFWSPRTEVPAEVKYGVGIAMWLLTGAYFCLMGRRRAT